MLTTRYYWEFFLSGLYFIGFLGGVRALIIMLFKTGDILLVLILSFISAGMFAFSVVFFRKGIYLQNEHFKSLCQKNENLSSKEEKKQLLKD